MIEYKPKTEYYTIVTNEQLDTIVPNSVVEFMNYSPDKVHTLRSACFPFPIELEDGNYLINIQLSNTSYYENKCVNGFITKEGFDLAISFYGIDNIFTDISNLKYKEII